MRGGWTSFLLLASLLAGPTSWAEAPLVTPLRPVEEESIVDPLRPVEEESVVDPLRPVEEESIVDPFRPVEEEPIVDPHRLVEGEPIVDPLRPDGSRPGLRAFLVASLESRVAVDPVPEEHDNARATWRNLLGLSLSVSPRRSIKGAVSLRLAHWTRHMADQGIADCCEADAELAVQEAYVKWSWDGLELRVGALFSLWGDGTFFRPAQLVHGVDFRFLDGDPEDRYVPAKGLDLRWYYSSEGTLQLLLLPLFSGHRGALVGRESGLASPNGPALASFPLFSLLTGLGVMPPDEFDRGLRALGAPSPGPLDAGVGARWTEVFWGVDLGVGIFFAPDRNPMLEMDRDLALVFATMAAHPEALGRFDLSPLFSDPEAFAALNRLQSAEEAPVFESAYPHRLAMELDLLKHFGAWGFSLELASSPAEVCWRIDEGEPAGFVSARYPVSDLAVGLRWESEEVGDMASLELHHRHIFDVDEDARFLGGAVDELQLALGGRLELGEEITLEGAGLWDLLRRDEGALYGEAKWALDSTLALSLSARWFFATEADELSPGRLQDASDRVAFSLTWLGN